LSFLRLHRAGEVYQMPAPTMWDVDFQTAVAQAEVEDREVRGAAHRIRFGVADGGSFTVLTTRPELLAARVRVVVAVSVGEETAVDWGRAHRLPLRQIVGRAGRLEPIAWGSPGWESRDPQ